MGYYHSTDLAYGFEIPATTDYDALDEAIADQPIGPDSVGHITVGDYEKTLLVTRCTEVEENTIVRLTADTLAQPAELAAWEEALHDVAVRLGYPDHPAPAWLVVHNYR
jgi:hypothetical protein